MKRQEDRPFSKEFMEISKISRRGLKGIDEKIEKKRGTESYFYGTKNEK